MTFREVVEEHIMVLGSALVNLMLVCKLWRAVVINEPCLWALQHIEVFDALERDEDCYSPVIARSGNLPLALNFADEALDQWDLESLTEKYNQAYGYIQSKASRVGSLSLSVYNSELFRPVLDALLSTPFPLLELLDVMMPINDETEDYYRWALADCNSFCTSAPLLRTVYSSNIQLPWDSTIATQLTHVNITLDSPFIGSAPTTEQFLRFSTLR